MHPLKSQRVVSINYLMHEINSLTDDLYEALIDGETADAASAVAELNAKLSYLLETLEDAKTHG
jgi:chemotaxis regulatin CheY-phosphate phosphatase CheZ